MSASLDDLAVFLAIARVGSVSGAALKLHRPKSSVSRALARLEAALGEQLVQRTTRRSRLSAAGEGLLARAEPLVEALAQNLTPSADAQTPSGLLRITCTVDFGAIVVAELVARFVDRHPAVRVEVHATNAIVDLVAGGFDLGIRFSAKRGLRDSTLVARRLGTLRGQLVASPAYLARRGAPRTLQDLRTHDWVTYAGTETFLLVSKGKSRRVTTSGRIRCNDMFFARAAVRAGAGVAVLPSFLAEPELDAGGLMAVLPQWQLASGALWLVYPPTRKLPAKVTAFSQLVVEALRAG